jgi:integrase
VLAYYGDYLTPLVITVLNTGLRKGEALTLDWKNVQLEGIPTVEVVADQAKSYKSRKIPLNDTAIQILKRWKSQGTGIGPVFPNPANGLPMSDIKTAWRKLLKAAKINSFRFHDLRHDFASQLVMKGADLYRVKDLLGHSSIAVTERYAHLAPKALKDAVDLIG